MAKPHDSNFFTKYLLIAMLMGGIIQNLNANELSDT